MIERALDQVESDWRFLTFEVGPDALGDAMRGVRALGLRGAKIIEPHREAVLEFVDERTDHARLAQSANCVSVENGRLIADNTLGVALVDLLNGVDGKQVWILGAGSTARAIAAAMALAGAASIGLVGRSIHVAESVAKELSDQTRTPIEAVAWPADKLVVPAEVDVLVNATTIGSVDPDERLPIDIDSLRIELTVADVNYYCDSTTIDGLSILVEQTALALKRWSDIDADRAAMRDAAEEFLAI
jgi:shikimate dehydrogenase